MEVIELIIDEDKDLSGIEAISVVEHPAIEENFVALSKEYKFERVDGEKRLLVGPLLIPDKKIYRRDGNKEYYVFFSKDTIRKASELYLMRGNQNNATFEHKEAVNGLTLVESWIIDSKENDKSKHFGMDLPEGTWMGAIKVNNDVIWEDYVKTGQVKGFSIEGYFVDKLVQEDKEEDLSEEIEIGLALLKIKAELLKKKYQLEKISFDYDGVLSTDKGTELAKRLISEGNDLYIISARDVDTGMINKAKDLGIPLSRVYATGSNKNKIDKVKELNIATHYDNNENVISELDKIGKLFLAADSYTDYPKEATENAKIALRYAEENGWGECGTPVGKARANQLANGEPISEDTISRMASFERHRQNSQKELGDGCGRLMWLAWGGDAGIEWAQRKLDQIKNK